MYLGQYFEGLNSFIEMLSIKMFEWKTMTLNTEIVSSLIHQDRGNGTNALVCSMTEMSTACMFDIIQRVSTELV